MITADSIIDSVGNLVRRFIKQFARFLNYITRGKLKPNGVTIIGFLAHLPIGWLIATNRYEIAAILLIIFGLFDTLDGELARIQKNETKVGALLDSVTDRLKEIIIYSAAAYSFISLGHPYQAVWAVVACGMSLTVSYIRAKLEIFEASNPQKSKSNIKSGLMRFEVRNVIIILGLLFKHLDWSIVIIAIFATYTVFQRLYNLIKKLNVQA